MSMSRPVRLNEATAAFRTAVFRVLNDDGSSKTDLSAATAKLYVNGAAGVNSTNNFAHVADGFYALVCTQAEVNGDVGDHILVAPVSAAGYNIVPGELVVVNATSYDADLTADDIWGHADAVALIADIAAILVDTSTTLDDKIDAIKTKTDQFTFGVANQVNANTKSMNDETVQGDGTSGNLWRGV